MRAEQKKMEFFFLLQFTRRTHRINGFSLFLLLSHMKPFFRHLLIGGVDTGHREQYGYLLLALDAAAAQLLLYGTHDLTGLSHLNLERYIVPWADDGAK